MDPQACLLRLYRAIAAKDWSEAVSALNDYYQWRVKDGFQPPFTDSNGKFWTGDMFAYHCANKLADALEPQED